MHICTSAQAALLSQSVIWKPQQPVSTARQQPHCHTDRDLDLHCFLTHRISGGAVAYTITLAPVPMCGGLDFLCRFTCISMNHVTYLATGCRVSVHTDGRHDM